ncbi:MAG TPA: fructose-bisphosphate aldolase [Actinomycetota bacterium]
MANGPVRRTPIGELGLSTGKKARLHRIIYQSGLKNGTALFLPYDQGLEHGPRDFFENPAAGDPKYIVKLAVEGGFNGVALQIGTAEKFFWDYAGEVPLILKLNGRTEIPPAGAPRSPLNASVADAVRLGADAVGYTLYVGSEQQEADFEALARVRQDAHRSGLPLIVWSYPRGKAVDAKGGKESFYEVDYAARTAAELGADIVKVNFPKGGSVDGVPKAYAQQVADQEAVNNVVASAVRTPVLLSGGEKGGDEEVLDKARMAMEAGALGLIFGRNIWQREHDESLRFVARLRELLEKYPS